MAAPTIQFSRKILQNLIRYRVHGAARAGCCTRNMCKTSDTGPGTPQHDDSPEQQDAGDETEYNTKVRILQSSMPFVHTHGWTHKAIAKGAEVEGLPGVAHGLFPRGGVELVFYFYTDSNRRLADQLAQQVEQEKTEPVASPGAPHIRPFIRGAVETRLRMIIPYLDKWPQAMAMMTMPQNVPEALSNLTHLTDDIWYYAGDQSTDFNWYTKRATLAAVYKATEVFMVQDKSPDHEATWEFLDRRIEDFSAFAKFSKNSQEARSVMSEACKGLFIMGRNIIGANSRA